MKRLFLKLSTLVCLIVLIASQQAAAFTQSDFACANAGGTGGTCFYDQCPASGSTPSSSAPATSGSIAINGPFLPKAMPGDKIKVGDSYQGNASTFGNDPATGYNDPGAGNTQATGIGWSQPGIAVYNAATERGWWAVIAPNGKSAILQQTDYGPSTSRIVDITSVAARAVFSYPEGSGFPTDQGQWKLQYMGQTQPPGAITTEYGGSTGTAPASSSATGQYANCCPAGGTATPPATTPSTPSGTLVWPFATKSSSQYNRIDQGWDIQDSAGAAIYAIAPGTIHVYNKDTGNFGNDYPTEELDNSIGGPSNFVYYGHVHVDPSVKGKHVDAGQVIAHANVNAGDNGSGAPPGWLEIGFAQPGTDAPVDSGSGITPGGQKMHDLLIDASPGAGASTPSTPSTPSSGSTACCASSLGGPADGGPVFGIAFPQVSDTADLAKRLDDYIKKTQPSSPLIGLGADFVTAGQKYNVNPALEVAIAYKESSLGINQVANSHDAWGLTAQGDVSGYPYVGGEYAFPSWKVGIEQATKYVGVNYTAPGASLYSTTVLGFMQHYTPPNYQGQAQITLGVMHTILDGISTSPGATTTPPSPTNACGSTTTPGAATSPVNIIKHDVFGNGDGAMGHPPTMIGLHYTEGNPQTPDDVVSALKDPGGLKGCNHITHTCSVQLTIDPKGNVYQLTSSLDVVTENIINFNNADIGIEIMGADEQALLNNSTQFQAVVNTVVQLMKQYNIKMVEDFSNKSGLMGHIEADNWSQAHLGNAFKGIYSSDTVKTTGSHQDPGLQYMSKVRAAVGPALGP